MARRDPWVTQYLPGLIRAGLSGRQALERLRTSHGVPIRTQTFYRAWGETKAALDKWGALAEVPLGRRPAADEITPYSARQARGFLYSFDVLVRNRSSGETFYTPSAFRTNRPVRFETAMGHAVDAIALADPEGSPELADMQVLGAIPLEVREYVPEEF